MVTTTTTITTTDEAKAGESVDTKSDSTTLRLYPISLPLPNPPPKMATTTTTTAAEAEEASAAAEAEEATAAAAAKAEARESLSKKLDRLKEHAKDMASRHPVAGAAAAVAISAVGAYFLWPVAAPAVAMMKAPGAAGVLVSRAAFLAKKKLYFKLLHSVGAAAAVAALA